MENLNKSFPILSNFIEKFVMIFYKATLQNLGSTNIGVRKNSEQVIKQLNDISGERIALVAPLANMILFNSNARLKPALID